MTAQTLGDWQRDKARAWRCEWCDADYQDQEPASWHLGLLHPVKNYYRLDLMTCVCASCIQQAWVPTLGKEAES